MRFELGPALEAALARDHELRVGELERIDVAGEAREVRRHARERFRVAGLGLAEQRLGALPLVGKIRGWGECRHTTSFMNARVSAGAGHERGSGYANRPARWDNPFPRTGRALVLDPESYMRMCRRATGVRILAAPAQTLGFNADVLLRDPAIHPPDHTAQHAGKLHRQRDAAPRAVRLDHVVCFRHDAGPTAHPRESPSL